MPSEASQSTTPPPSSADTVEQCVACRRAASDLLADLGRKVDILLDLVQKIMDESSWEEDDEHMDEDSQ